MKNNPNSTNISSVLLRASVIFPLMVIVFVGLLTISLTLGVKSGELDKVVVKPFKQLKDNIANGIQKAMKESSQNSGSTVTIIQNESSTATSESTIEINGNSGSRVQINQPNYVYPTQRVYPSPAPGQPGSKEWEEQFQKNWDDMEKNIQNAKKEQCERAPELCN